MTTSYSISEQEYVRAVMLASRYSRVRILVYSGIAAAYVGLIYLDTGKLFDWPLWLLAGVALFLIAFQKTILPFLLRRAYRKYSALREPLSSMTIEQREDGLYFTTPDATAKLPREKILKWRQNEEFILIYIMPRQFHIIPKKIADAGFDIGSMVRWLEETAGKDK